MGDLVGHHVGDGIHRPVRGEQRQGPPSGGIDQRGDLVGDPLLGHLGAPITDAVGNVEEALGAEVEGGAHIEHGGLRGIQPEACAKAKWDGGAREDH